MPTGVYLRKCKPATERFWAKVRKTDTCWLWTGATTSSGYGQFRVEGGRRILAHRWAYEQEHGPIPAGLVIDHLCRVRNCVWPTHLESVTLTENILRGNGQPAQNARKTHCPKGHPYAGDNLYLQPDGGRRCLECQHQRHKQRKQEVA